MAYWLMKSEPDVYSFDDLKKAGDKGSEWHGVRNYQARNNMRAMQLGDKVFYYHSNIGLEIVGVAEVIALCHPEEIPQPRPKAESVESKVLDPPVLL